MFMKNSVFSLLVVSFVLFVSCKKNTLLVDDYSETRHTVRFYMELSTITECVGQYVSGTVKDDFIEHVDLDSATLDSIYLPKGPYNNDGRTRTGNMHITHYGLKNDTATVFNVSSTYYRDSLRVDANFQYFNTSTPGTNRFVGSLTFTYLTGLQATFNFNMSHIGIPGNYNFPITIYYLYGSFSATDTKDAVFSSTINTPLRSYECNNASTNNDSKYRIRYLENGNVSLTTSKQGTGVLWFGYNDVCDTYCVVLWEDKDIQLNIDMVNY